MLPFLLLLLFASCETESAAERELAIARETTDPTDVTNNAAPPPVVDPRAQTVQELPATTKRADPAPEKLVTDGDAKPTLATGKEVSSDRPSTAPTQSRTLPTVREQSKSATSKTSQETASQQPTDIPESASDAPNGTAAKVATGTNAGFGTNGQAPGATTKPKTVPTATEDAPPAAAPAAAKPDHAAFDRQLRRFVNAAGDVDYAAWKRNQSDLNAYLSDLAAHPPAADWSRNERLAYWINAYNAFTIDLILDNYPVAKITDLDGGKPWDVKRIKLGDKTYSLNQIEHEIIRPQFQEPRIHFAVNCAAASCPPLHNRAFTADNLNGTLERVTRSFVNNAGYNQISGKSATLSKIFDWYGEDFNGVRDYVARYYEGDLAADAEIDFRDYDWSLNKQ